MLMLFGMTIATLLTLVLVVRLVRDVIHGKIEVGETASGVYATLQVCGWLLYAAFLVLAALFALRFLIHFLMT